MMTIKQAGKLVNGDTIHYRHGEKLVNTGAFINFADDGTVRVWPSGVTAGKALLVPVEDIYESVDEMMGAVAMRTAEYMGRVKDTDSFVAFILEKKLLMSETDDPVARNVAQQKAYELFGWKPE